MNDEDFGEERANLHQRIDALERQVENMTVRLSDGGLNALSLRVAHLVEDQFAQHHPGGRTQRLAKIQIIIREALREIATGEKRWDAWQPGRLGSAPDKVCP